jgi:hypothetical protein
MAVYKIFPEKDNTIYSLYPSLNTGLDEILELRNSKITTEVSNYSQLSRILIKFPTSEINDIINNKIGSSNFDAYLKLYLSNAKTLLDEYTIEAFPISGSWDMGFGKYSNVPISVIGSSWKWRDTSGSNAWIPFTSSLTTSSYVTGFEGGGVWYTGSNGVNLSYTQSFIYSDEKDLNIKVTNIIDTINSGSIDNKGIILKFNNSIEFNSGSTLELMFYSMDTHTIYPPCLELKWDDSSYSIGSGNIIDNSNVMITLDNNKNYYPQNSVSKFRINVKDSFPTRRFQTSSLYLDNKFLPTSSYWSIRDLDTNEIIIDFDENYTKISADTTSNYFNVYCAGLQPERYYSIRIKSIIGSETIIDDNNFYFKIVN